MRFGHLFALLLLAGCGGKAHRGDDSGDSSVAGDRAAAPGHSGVDHAGAAASGGSGTTGEVVPGGASGEGEANGGTAGRTALEPIIEAFCRAARTCCARDGLPMRLDECESALGDHNPTVLAVARGAVRLDVDKLEACRAAYMRAASTCEQEDALQACRGVVIGLMPEGGPCESGADCAQVAGELTCLRPFGGGGACIAVPRGNAGDTCSFSCREGEDCATSTYGVIESPLPAVCRESDGLYCAGLGHICQPLAEIGAPCVEDAQCGGAAFCGGTCQKLASPGEACVRCVSSFDCVEEECVSPRFASSDTCQGASLGPY